MNTTSTKTIYHYGILYKDGNNPPRIVPANSESEADQQVNLHNENQPLFGDKVQAFKLKRKVIITTHIGEWEL